ncbi:MAG: shikimate kinase [Betaproteobacteria bacterium]|nr:MAG: shikimate kinase [Betaproteobacteria bacterium]
MGAGKTTIGQLLAKRLNLTFLDSDQVIEDRTGVSISTIFEIEGEPAFRAREVQIIDELSVERAIVLSTGGGAIGNPLTRQRLRERGFVVYLHTTPETAYERIRRKGERPLLRVDNPLATLRSLYEVRHPLYEQTAHAKVESYRDRPQSVVADILTLLRDTTAQ